MFFHFKVPPAPEQSAPKVELNIHGEPMYIYGPGGELIINDPTLTKVIPEDTKSTEETDSTSTEETDVGPIQEWM